MPKSAFIFCFINNWWAKNLSSVKKSKNVHKRRERAVKYKREDRYSNSTTLVEFLNEKYNSFH